MRQVRSLSVSDPHPPNPGILIPTMPYAMLCYARMEETPCHLTPAAQPSLTPRRRMPDYSPLHTIGHDREGMRQRGEREKRR